MIKASKSTAPGIPFRTDISPLETKWRLHDTNAAFEDEWKRKSARAGGLVNA
ncbi:hypothetical protein G6021_16580 [Dietzia sp. CW19]|nr:hypothetical protein [Dietzia sp. CW19]